MQTPTRFEINGVRHYRAGDDPNRVYPSVTSILGKTAGAKANQRLQAWNLNNPGAREAAAKRGTAIHAACEDYIRGKEALWLLAFVRASALLRPKVGLKWVLLPTLCLPHLCYGRVGWLVPKCGHGLKLLIIT